MVGACVAGGVHGRGGGEETATAEDGTHPTGMHSCFMQKKEKQFVFLQ